MKPMILNRRGFLKQTATASMSLMGFSLLPAIRGAESPSNKIKVGSMGT